MIKRRRENYNDLTKNKKLNTLKDIIGEVVEAKLTPVVNNQIEMSKELSDIKQDLQITKEGIQVELRHDIRNSCRRCITQGFRTFDDVEEVNSMHDKYEKLGENGVTNALFDEFEKLRTVPNDYKKESSTRKKTNKQILTETK